MKLLLDTHSFLWFVMGSGKLSRDARSLIEDQSHEKLLSVASVWEMAIKHSLGKLNLTQRFDIFIAQQLSQNGFSTLPIQNDHVFVVDGLPFHHRDPFDRMLIAQSLAEQISIISADSVFDADAVQRLW